MAAAGPSAVDKAVEEATSAVVAAEAGKTSKDYYFDSYSHFGIHEEMLKDSVRTETYRKAIVNNKHLFKDKVVLDVGCGTGILCMFAAKAGAKRVIGLDCATIAVQARQIVKDNGFEDVITIVQGKVEDLASLPHGIEKVDIIVSEWMGYFLLYESMLDTVLYARDRWLVPGGLIFPDKASLLVCAIEDGDYRTEKIDFWDDVYGFDMSCIKKLALTEPLVDMCEAQQVLSDSQCVLNIDIYTVKKEELDFAQNFRVKIARNDYCHALVAYFNVEFSKTHKNIGFSTSPRHKYTHWKQTVFYFNEPVPVTEGDELVGRLDVRRNAVNPRDLDIRMEAKVESSSSDAAKDWASAMDYRLR